MTGQLVVCGLVWSVVLIQRWPSNFITQSHMEENDREMRGCVFEEMQRDRKGALETEERTSDLTNKDYMVDDRILKFLDVKSLLACRLVNRSWNARVVASKLLWRYWCQHQPVQLDNFRPISNTDYSYFSFFMASKRILKGLGPPQPPSDRSLIVRNTEPQLGSPRIDVVLRDAHPFLLIVVNPGISQQAWTRELSNFKAISAYNDLIVCVSTINNSMTYLRVMSVDGQMDYKIKTSVHMMGFFSAHSSGHFILLICQCGCNELRLFNDQLREVTVQVPIPDPEDMDEEDTHIKDAYFLSDIGDLLVICVLWMNMVTVIACTDEGKVLCYCQHFRRNIFSVFPATTAADVGLYGFVIISKGHDGNFKVEKIVAEMQNTSGIKTRTEWEWKLTISGLPNNAEIYGVGKHFMLVGDLMSDDLYVYQRNVLVATIPNFLESRRRFDMDTYSKDPYFNTYYQLIPFDYVNIAWLDGLSPETTRPQKTLISSGVSFKTRLLWTPRLWGHLDSDESHVDRGEELMNETTDQSCDELQDRSTDMSSEKSLVKLVETPEKPEHTKEPPNKPQKKLGVWKNAVLFSQRLREVPELGVWGSVSDADFALVWHTINML